MTSKAKIGFGFGVVVATFTIIEVLIRDDDLTQKEIFIAIASGLIAGIVGGFLFSWLLWKFVTSKFFYDATKIEINADETILFETRANHYKGAEAVGGKLYLTDKRLIFKSHKLNIQNHKLIINLSDIKQVARRKTLGIINNGLLVHTIQGLTERFVVEKAAEWVNQLSMTKRGE